MLTRFLPVPSSVQCNIVNMNVPLIGTTFSLQHSGLFRRWTCLASLYTWFPNNSGLYDDSQVCYPYLKVFQLMLSCHNVDICLMNTLAGTNVLNKVTSYGPFYMHFGSSEPVALKKLAVPYPISLLCRKFNKSNCVFKLAQCRRCPLYIFEQEKLLSCHKCRYP